MKPRDFCLLALALALASPGCALADACEKTALAKTYEKMHKDDQALRGRYIRILEMEHRHQKVDLKEKERLEISISDTDNRNQTKLDDLIRRCGWPGTLNSNRASFAAFLTIQHADLDYQLKYLDTVKAANKRGEIPGMELAMLIDRILVKQGKPQLYGTEFEYGSNKVAPIADPINLNQRRKELGLPAI
ncbi:hypothetical protein SAMN05428959_103502 [Duganella sp. CF517]|uniref:DUF6624 domain-containing protein n=1 Tax=Duganella sp. CF517 TaxID=1881038 RepID=UPI0008AE3020|nr:DUF6624 domain-containing protein [Duganella sp. CF517]SEN86745.1 hypothetical protein SAMN05428959_103502 [Duganella sp. CF517]